MLKKEVSEMYVKENPFLVGQTKKSNLIYFSYSIFIWPNFYNKLRNKLVKNLEIECVRCQIF